MSLPINSQVGYRGGQSGAQLRVALLGTRGIPAAYGGFETFAEQLAVRLVQRGHQVTVYSEADQAGLPDTCYKGVTVRHVHRPLWGAVSVIAYDCRCIKDACTEHDLLYMLGYGAAWACWWGRKVSGKAIWLNIDGLEWARSKWSRGARCYLRIMEWVSSWAPTRVIADAQAIADRYHALYPKGVPCSFVAYGASHVDTAAYPPDILARLGLLPGCYVLVVARPEPENHLLEIVEGYKQSGVNWPLVVVGNVQPVTHYQQRLLANASDRVRFIGGVYDPVLLTTLRLHAGCHVHGHSVGGTNPSLLEALACGNLIIAHDNLFNREVARGASVYFQSSEDLARHLVWASNMNSDVRQALAEEAKDIIASNYTWDRIVDVYEALMQLELTGAALHKIHP